MRLAHYEPLSLSDFPGRLATTVFTVGCNFACPYCHNPELVTTREDTPQLTEEAFFAFLKRRRGKLNGVCITGGEPTLHADLVGFVERIRALDYAVKLDTNGSNPEMLGHLLETSSLDYVAMDVKAPPSRYSEMTGNPYALALAETSIRLLAECNTVHEYRTTVLPLLFGEVDIDNIICMLPSGSHYVIQNFVATKTLDPNLVHARGFEPGDLETIADRMRLHYPLLHISTRGGI
ncbi:anaerobic ribonucleoside-triphosphate reductase activating protein [Candidatus Cryosericum septentrionale]|jgi:pyruvate formate lyase activating enzyme|uniref:Anaerobic ribonucleoside-triphosphate reductase activating protein n=1 Tax=Candidatus Cryosericum septentrionale TaxID=2290913 RepID=A0A398DNS2_9BACT|nr:anaerobic ribonucleoside-triphosphate reductase activating protein [Candidatus Cryosericum septentrionale]RIE15599.1 anaerobic ribonucleoside-triphosphate reductase activating protein [Candidatus Cryosericum septentrionale]